MKPAKISKKIISPLQWQDFSGGVWLQEQEQELLERYITSIYGYYLLKLGHLSTAMDCQNSMIRHHINVAATPQIPDGIVAELTALPIQPSSIDLCLLSHTLDFSSDPHQILREVERVLTSDGHIIISGFNPISLMGLRAHLGRRRINPWACRMFTPMRIKDWLDLLGFDVLADERFAFTSFAGQQPFTQCFEQVGRQYARPVASCYWIVARKRTATLTPIRPKWRVKNFMPVRPLAN